MSLDTPPPWLDTLAKQYWRKLAPSLMREGILTATTYEMVGSLCKHYSVYRQAVATLEKEGRIITTDTGRKIRHPETAGEKQAWECYAKAFNALGIHSLDADSQGGELATFLADDEEAG